MCLIAGYGGHGGDVITWSDNNVAVSVWEKKRW